MIKLKGEKEKFKVPKRVQDAIPVQTIYDDGIFKVGPDKYSASYRFNDINYTAESDDVEENILVKYSALLNSFDPYSTIKLTINKHRRNRAFFENEVLLPLNDDGLNEYRDEVNADLLSALDGRNSAIKERMFTVSVNKKNIEEARDYFSRIKSDLERHFSELGSSVQTMSTDERLRIFHDFYRHSEDIYYHFDMNDAMKKGHSFKDYLCPDTMEFKSDYFKMGDRYGRVLFLKDYANVIRDRVLQDITGTCEDMVVSIDIISIPVDVARRAVENKLLGVETNMSNWQRKQNQNNNFSATPPYAYTSKQESLKEVLDDMDKRDQKLMEAVLTVVHTADSKAQLDSDTASILQLGNANMLQFGILRFQQLEGLNTVLPFGVRKIDIFRTLTSESLSAFVPFNATDVFQPGGVYLGQNPISKTMIIADRRLQKNGNEFILGSPGGGKSMQAKWEILCKALGSDADIIIIDPQREYGPLVKALGGETINISAESENHINALDISANYGEGRNPLILKSQLIMSLCDMVSKDGLPDGANSIIDRCMSNIYKDYQKSGYTGTPPTLQDFRFELLKQDEPAAQALALNLELFTAGSLNVFAQQTNVNTDSRLISYDILDLGEQLRSIGMLIVLDNILNRITKNRSAGKQTLIFIDEIYLLFQHEYSANFLFILWKTVRKFGACCTGITQNVDDLLQSHTARTMLANSEFVVMLNQAASDREALAGFYDISDQSLRFITNAAAGHGLLKIGDKLIPFEHVFKKNTKIYKLMSTKPGEEL